MEYRRNRSAIFPPQPAQALGGLPLLLTAVVVPSDVRLFTIPGPVREIEEMAGEDLRGWCWRVAAAET